jgi:hypothetical protein
VPIYGSSKESFSGSDISTLARQEVNCQTLLIDSAIKIRPSPSDSKVRFVYTPRSADRPSIATPILLELRYIVLNPSKDCCMREIDPSLGHHLDEVAVAQPVGDIPSDAENND